MTIDVTLLPFPAPAPNIQTQSQTEFSANADSFVSHLVSEFPKYNTFASEANALATEVNANATNAATSETNAATSETNAATSAANAATSEINTLSYLETFKGQYYGALASDPTQDPNGDPIGEGDLYWNTVSNRMLAYDGINWAAFDGTVNTVATIEELLARPTIGSVRVLNYHADVEGGGGTFYWDSARDKADHNGGTVIDPDVTFPTDWTNQTQLTTWLTAGTGTGCWVRQYDGAVNVKWFGAKGDGVTLDTLPIISALESGIFTIEAINGEVYLSNSEITIPENVIFDMRLSTIKADVDFPNTDNLIKLSSANSIIKNGKINGNRLNLTATFTTGTTGCGVLVTDGADGSKVINMETFNCPTNGQVAISTASTIDNILFYGYKSYDNGWTGTGGEAQVNGSPLTNIYFENGETYDNLVGGDIRIQGINNFIISNHKGYAGTVGHGPIVIGVGEANNTCTGNISNSFLESSVNALPSFDINALVGGTGPYAGLTSLLEVNLENVRIKGAGGANGIYAQNGAIVTGSSVLVENHANNLRAVSGSLVMIDNLTLRDSTGSGALIDCLSDIKNLTIEGWGDSLDALFFLDGASGSTITNCRLGYPISASGSHDGVSSSSTLADSTSNFIPDEFVGYYVRNTTDGSKGLITGNTSTTITATLSGGTDNDWDASDTYEVTKENGQDGVGVSGNPSDIALDINYYTGNGLRVGGVSGAVLNTWKLTDLGAKNTVDLIDGILAPAATGGTAKLYIDISDGDLKVIFGDGVIKTIATDS